MNVAAFAVIIAVGRFGDSIEGGETLDGFAGLAARKPGLAAAMTLFMLSLAGVPPLAGFLAKLYVFGAAIQADLTWLAIVGVVNSAVSAYYYLRVVAVMYMRESGQEQAAVTPLCPALAVGIGLASAAIVILGLWPVPVLDLARAAVVALVGG
jgi:NADH-quinone oxidoreductase subunit N